MNFHIFVFTKLKHQCFGALESAAKYCSGSGACTSPSPSFGITAVSPIAQDPVLKDRLSAEACVQKKIFQTTDFSLSGGGGYKKIIDYIN